MSQKGIPCMVRLPEALKVWVEHKALREYRSFSRTLVMIVDAARREEEATAVGKEEMPDARPVA